MNAARHYVPGLAYHALTPLYDRALRLIFDEVALKSRLLDQAALASGQRVLDLGCGTGTLLLLVHQREPGVGAFGLDGGTAMVARAQVKIHAAGASPHVAVALAQEMPLAARSFDHILSTLFFHHLPTAAKPAAKGLLPRRMEEAGFEDVRDVARIDTLVGTVSYCRGRRPPDAHG